MQEWGADADGQTSDAGIEFMSIPVTCAGCGRTFRVKDKYAGKMGSCPFCAGTVRVPKVELAAEFDALGRRPCSQCQRIAAEPGRHHHLPALPTPEPGGMPYCISCGTLLGETKPGA